MTPVQIEARLNDLASTDANRPEVKLRSAISLGTLCCRGFDPASRTSRAFPQVQALISVCTDRLD